MRGQADANKAIIYMMMHPVWILFTLDTKYIH